MKGIPGMLPGGQRALNQMGGNLDEGIFDKNEAIIMSMTKEERLRPFIINGQRRARIAEGRRRDPTEVNSLMKQWGEMNKMMGRMRTMANQAQAPARRAKGAKKGKKMRMPNIPGLDAMGLGGMGGLGGTGTGGPKSRYGPAAPDGSADGNRNRAVIPA